MSQYTQVKAKATNVMFAGIGGGVFIFLLGLVANSGHLSTLGIIGSAAVCGVGQVMRQNAKKLRTEQKDLLFNP